MQMGGIKRNGTSERADPTPFLALFRLAEIAKQPLYMQSAARYLRRRKPTVARPDWWGS